MTPKALLDAPTLEPSLNYYYEQFLELVASRNYSFSGPLPIPISEIKAHCDIYGFYGSEARDLARAVRILDNTWLSVRAKRAEAESKAKV